MVRIEKITPGHIEGFRHAVDVVARERKYLAFLEAPPLEHTRTFVRDIIAKGYPHLVVLDGEWIVGWCDITPPGRAVMAHVGTLGMGLLSAYRDRGLGRQVMIATLAAADGLWLMFAISAFLDLVGLVLIGRALWPLPAGEDLRGSMTGGLILLAISHLAAGVLIPILAARASRRSGNGDNGKTSELRHAQFHALLGPVPPGRSM